jgi:hypothetical protein
MCAKYIMAVLELMIIILLLLVLFILLSGNFYFVLQQPMPVPAPAPEPIRKKATGGCRDTGYGCCPYSEIPKLNEIGSNCRYQN